MRKYFLLLSLIFSPLFTPAQASRSDLVRACHAPEESEDVVCALMRGPGLCQWSAQASTAESCRSACDRVAATLAPSLRSQLSCQHGSAGILKSYK